MIHPLAFAYALLMCIGFLSRDRPSESALRKENEMAKIALGILVVLLSIASMFFWVIGGGWS